MGIVKWQENQDKCILTTGHIRTSNAAQRVGCLLVVVAHADSSAITLVNAIDEKISESGMSASKLGKSGSENDNRHMREEHLAGFFSCCSRFFVLRRGHSSINEPQK